MASKSTTETKRESGLPKGVLDTLKGEMGDVYKKLKGLDISPQQLAGMNEDQKKALKRLADSGQLEKFSQAGGAQLLKGAGAMGEGQDVLSQAARGEMAIGAGDITKLADQLVDKGGLQARIGAMEGDVTRQLQEGALPSIYRGATGTGNVGSSRSAIAQGVAQRGASEAMAKNAALMRAQAQQDAMQRAQTVLGGNLQTQMGAGKNLAQLGSTAIGQMGDTALMNQQAIENQLRSGTIGQGQAQQALDVQRQNELMKKMKESGITDAQGMINLLSSLRGVTDTGAATQTTTASGPSTSDLMKQMGISTAGKLATEWGKSWLAGDDKK